MANQQYEIHVKGYLSRDWADWLENMHMCCLENGEMVLSGWLADQAALMGILNKLNGLNLAILSVNETGRKDPGQADCKEPSSTSES
jgi:hypothetical protein